MTVARRDLLVGAGALIAAPAMAARLGSARAVPRGLPMPAPVDRLPTPLPMADPSRMLLDRGWLFHEGDIVPPPPLSHHETYLSVKAGAARGAAAIDFDDSDWQPVRLPHDWASYQPFDRTANVSQGYRRRGIGWYRRTLTLDPADRGKLIALQFDAIATHATIWVNGSIVTRNWSGYNSIQIDLTPFARFGDAPNVIAIRADADAMEGWWYEGAGLYRHAWLAVRAPVSIVEDGVHCDPRRDTGGGWRVPVTVTLASAEGDAAAVTVEVLVRDPDGRTVATGRTDAAVAALERADARLSLDVEAPRLWSVETPTLYTVEVRVIRDGRAVDTRRIAIGFRTIRFDADRGLFVNDRPVKLKGVCLHQDHAGVGTAVPDALLAWRLERLQAMGCNAIRCSHNAPAAELLDLADRMGFLVMDENRVFNPAPDPMAQLEWMVRRDRNHPSVILWSVFNEEPMQGSAAGVEMVRRMAASVHRLDDSRPVTAAMNGAFFDPVNVSSVVDVMGFNYYQADYDRFHALNPARPITSSEDTSAFQIRGAFATDRAAHVMTSYDDEAADWGGTHRATWKAIADRPFVAGGFVWTGFDYHGEPTPFEWPTVSSFFGIMDLCGFPKTAFGIHQAHWVDDRPVVWIAPHWNWAGQEGRPIRVMVMTNADAVELRLNGRTLGRQAVDRIMGNEWAVPYAPGRIEAVALRGNREVARAMHETAGPAVALRLTPARTVMAGDDEDAQPITIDAVDARGRHVPTADIPTRFAVTGGTLIGVGNGDPNSHESEKDARRTLFNGLAQMIVQADDKRGPIIVTAHAEGLRPARLRIDKLAAVPRRQARVTAAAQAVAEWRRSPPFATRPDPALAPADGDNNSWAFVRSGVPTPAESATSWRIYRTRVTPHRRAMAEGSEIAFAGIAGRAELWIDGRRVATKDSAAAGPLTGRLAPTDRPVAVALLVEAPAGAPSGIVGAVAIAR